MTDLTPEDRARAMLSAYVSERSLPPISTFLDAESVRAWLAVEAHILATHECPDVESDARVQAWNTIAQHPLFADCYQTEGTLVDAMVTKLDAAHTHTCQPVWRPTTRDEIQAGWEVRARHFNGIESTWGVAHGRGAGGDWLTEKGRVLTWDAMGWTYETTAPLPEPEPWDDDTLDEWEDALRATIDLDAGWTTSTRAVLDLLAERGLIDRPKAGA